MPREVMGPKRGPLNFPGRAAPGTGDNTTDRLGFDGSGRMITKRYLTGGINGSTYAYNNTSALVGQTTAYDHGGNKFYERSLQAADRSNLYQPVDNTGNIASPAPGYDSVNRLLQYQRGTLNGTGGYQNNGGGSVSSAIGLPNTDQSRTYSLDGLGNWKKSVYTAEGGTSAADVRNNNYVNQITQRTLAGSPQSALNYDENGNTTVAPAGLSYAEAVIASGPSLYWRLDETSGTTAADLSGNGDDGTYSTGVSFGQPGALLTSANMAVGFPGTGSVVNQEALNFSNTTVAAWVKLAALPTKGPQMIAGFAQAAQTQPSAPAINTSVLYVDISGNANWVVNDGTTAYTVASGPLQVGKWYFLVGTADGTTSTLYVNGSLAASTSAGSSQVGFVVPNFLVNGNAGFYGGALNAVVDEVAAYDFALTAQQIAGLYSAALAQPQVEMQYDALNRLIAVNRVSDGAAIAAYAYDAGNRRVRKTVTNGGLAGNIPNGTTDSCWFGWQTMEERNPSGGTDTSTKQYVWGNYIDECLQLNLLAVAGPQQLAVGVYYPLQDTLYRTMALVNSSGTPVEAYDTDAYGNTIIFTGPGPDNTWFTDDDTQSSYGANGIIYCGYRYDAETENYYVRNRYYSPTLGRWLSRDPIGYQGGINLYEYVNSSPVGNVDAEGLVGETNHTMRWALKSKLPVGTVVESTTIISISPFIPTGPGKTTESGWIYRSYTTTTPGEVVDTIRAIVMEPGSKCNQAVRPHQFTAATRRIVTNDSEAIGWIASGIRAVGTVVGGITAATGAGAVPGIIIAGSTALVAGVLVTAESYPPTGVSLSYYGTVVNPDQMISVEPEE